MDKYSRDAIIQEAVNIGEGLLNQAREDVNGLSWRTITMNDDRITWHKSESIYSGVSGILLFFIQLYKQTKSNDYLETIVKASKWLVSYCKNNPSNHFSFFTGRTGTLYALYEANKIIKDQTLFHEIESILELCKASLQMERNKSVVNDLINGISGTILGLIFMYGVFGKSWILDTIDLYVRFIVDKINFSDKGIYWDRSEKYIKGLCGFAHGAAGIGYLFLELGKFSNNTAFYWLANMSFQYENELYDQNSSNWPDFRKAIFSNEDFERHKNAYLGQDVSFFEPSDMVAWCHGAAGIGLSRLRAFQLMNDKGLMKDFYLALQKTEAIFNSNLSNKVSYTLCHGLGGNAILFLEAYRILKDQRYFKICDEVAKRAILSKQINGFYYSGYSINNSVEDTSLFMGNAGIGYFYLQLVASCDTTSILIPTSGISINKPRKGILSKSLPDLKHKVFGRLVKRVQYFSSHVKFDHSINTADDLFGKINTTLGTKEVIKDAFNFEKKLYQLEGAVDNNAYLYIKQYINKEYTTGLLGLSNKRLKSIILTTTDECVLSKTKWNWVQSEWKDNSNLKPSEFYNLFLIDPLGVNNFSLNYLNWEILTLFQNPNQVLNVIRTLTEKIEPRTIDEVNQIEDLVAKQIREALGSGILTSNINNMVY